MSRCLCCNWCPDTDGRQGDNKMVSYDMCRNCEASISTASEVVRGAHSCPDWDFMYISPSDPEWMACSCPKLAPPAADQDKVLGVVAKKKEACPEPTS